MPTIQYSDDPNKRRLEKMALWMPLGILAFILFVLLLGLIVQFLWNVTLADMFELSAITFWQAIGLFILAKLFFGFGVGGSPRRTRRRTKRRSTDGISRLADDEAFRSYWREQGRASYESFLEDRVDPSDAPPSPTDDRS